MCSLVVPVGSFVCLPHTLAIAAGGSTTPHRRPPLVARTGGGGGVAGAMATAFLWAHPWAHFQPALLPTVRRYTFTQSRFGVAVALLRRGMASAVPGTFLMFARQPRIPIGTHTLRHHTQFRCGLLQQHHRGVGDGGRGKGGVVSVEDGTSDVLGVRVRCFGLPGRQRI